MSEPESQSDQLASENSGEKHALSPFTRDFWRLFCALTLALVSSSFMNVSVFPLFDHVFTHARDISVLANATTLLAIGLIATFKPAFLHVGRLNVVMLSLLFTGCIILPAALALKLPLALTIGASALAIGRAWCVLVAGIACSKLSREQTYLLVVFAFVLQCVASTYAWIVPIWLGILLFLVIPWGAWALSWPDAKPILENAEKSDAPSDFSITQPSSFLPLASQLFVCLFLFHVAFGCSLRFGEVEGVPLSSFAIVIPITLIAAIALYFQSKGKRFPTDIAVQVSVLLVVGGFSAMNIHLAHANDVAVVLLSCGNTLFDMIAWMVLIAMASRNSRGAVAALAWGRGVSGLGTTLGAAIGVQANTLPNGQTELLGLFGAVLVLVFVGYALIGLKNFSFRAAIDGITPVADIAAEAPQKTFDERCTEIAATYNLTPRELEVFQMLARGRDAAYIQEQLVVSRNTVKAHVKHIYAKLGIHSHQDLIDLVE